MANLVRARSWGQAKPVVGSTVDWGHPLAARLRACFLFNEGGVLPIDIATGGPAAVTTNSGGVPQVGSGLRFVNGTARWVQKQLVPLVGAGNVYQSPWTVDCLVHVYGSTKGAFLTYGAIDSGGASIGIGGTTFDTTGTNLISADMARAWHATTTPVPSNGSAVHVAMTSNSVSGTVFLYMNGLLITSWSSLPIGSNDSIFQIGNEDHSTGRSPTCTIDTARLWNRQFTIGEVAALSAEPYALFQPPGPKILYIDLGVGGANQNIALTPATVTLTPVAPARTAARSAGLTPPSITVTPSSAGITNEKVYTSGSNVVTGTVTTLLALTPATITVTPQAQARSAARSAALSPATVTVTPVAPARTVGGAARALAPASVAVTPATPALTAAKSIAVTPASITVAPSAQTSSSGAITRALTAAAVSVTPVAPARTAARSVATSVATVTVTPVAPAPSAGSVTRAASPATVAVTPSSAGISNVGGANQTLALSPATITVTPVAPARTVGGVSRAAAPAIITVTSRSPGRVAAVARALAPASISVTPVPAGVAATGAAQSIAMAPATIVITPSEVARTAAAAAALTPALIHVAAQVAATVAAADLAVVPAMIQVVAIGLKYAPHRGCLDVDIGDTGSLAASVANTATLLAGLETLNELEPAAGALTLVASHALTATLHATQEDC